MTHVARSIYLQVVKMAARYSGRSLVDNVDAHADIRNSLRALCDAFPGEYWRELDRRVAYPEEFVRADQGGGSCLR